METVVGDRIQGRGYHYSIHAANKNSWQLSHTLSRVTRNAALYMAMQKTKAQISCAVAAFEFAI